jgi:MbtH protein
MDSVDSNRLFFVVVNEEEQYSIWLADQPVPAGWHTVGEPRSRQECLDYIEATWKDMRPLSVRVALDGAPARGAASTGDAKS